MNYLSEAKDLQGKRAVVRIDCDVDLRKEGGRLVVDEDFRLRSAIPAINYLKNLKAEKIILLGHLGRPKDQEKELSLSPIREWFDKNVSNCALVPLGELSSSPSSNFGIIENLRYEKGEEENDPEFAKKLSLLGDYYVNEAFGVSHRDHASITGIKSYLPSYLGIRFEGEIATLNWLKSQAPKPIVSILGGSKDDKLKYIDFLGSWSDYVLLGGKLPSMIKNVSDNVIVAKLNKEGKDITKKSIDEFKEYIGKAKTILWAGPMGVYEEDQNNMGSYEIAKTAAEAKAFKVAGGGDTHRILSRLNLWNSFNFVSVGGGAMLYYMKNNTLAGLD
jgi:3-phosphoglycerate kinase